MFYLALRTSDCSTVVEDFERPYSITRRSIGLREGPVDQDDAGHTRDLNEKLRIVAGGRAESRCCLAR